MNEGEEVVEACEQTCRLIEHHEQSLILFCVRDALELGLASNSTKDAACRYGTHAGLVY